MAGQSHYQRPEGHSQGHPDIFVHENVIERFGLPEVDYDNQARLYRDEIPGYPGKPTIYIDLKPAYTEPALTPHPQKKLSHDSRRKGDNIHVNLRPFLYGGRETVSPASLTRLTHELVLQAAGRALTHDRRLLHRQDYFREFWLPVTGGTVVGGIVSIVLPELVGAGVGLAAFVTAGVPNINELVLTRQQRVADEAAPLLTELVPRHRDDFSFPDTHN